MLSKANTNIPFGIGLDTKTDPKQVQPGKMLSLSNAVFQKQGLLEKRYGFGSLPTLPALDTTTLATFGGSLAAIGTDFYNYAPETETWYNKGAITAVTTEVTPLVRSATSQTKQDVAITPEGLSCAVWEDSDGTSKYQINDATSSQIVVSATNLPSTAVQPRVFILENYFIITFLATATHLQYISIPILNPTNPAAAVDLGTQVTSLTTGYDGYVANSKLYVAWSDVAPAVKVTYLDSTLVVATPQVIVTRQAKYMSVTVDVGTEENPGNQNVWLAFWDAGNSNLYAAVRSPTLASVLAPTVLANSANIVSVTSVANQTVATVFYETSNTYSYSSVRSDYISKTTCTQAGVAGTPAIILRSVALASKAFIVNSTMYVMVTYGGAYQPTYFLSDSSGNLSAKLAYSNGGGYPGSEVLASASISGTTVQIGYLFKDLLTAVNKSQGVANTNGIYSQTGINLVSWDINGSPMPTAEIGNNLHLGGGFLWMYDGTRPVEHSFHVWPEDLAITTSTGSGGLIAQQYYYQATYEWTDAQGNIHRSAPSVPLGQVTTTGSSTNTIKIPTLRLTYKTGASKVRIVIYRWSTAQQNYYQITSIFSPLLNNTSVDSVTYVDSAADSAILGNQLIYTTGGVIENIAAPAIDAITLYKSRLVLIDAEDKNLLWFSKQVIESTPVETSDLFTQYIAPTAGAQGSTGVNTALSAMDDKLIIFKRNAIYYMVGTGPDNTGANNDFSEPNYITSTAGCTNPRSIVFMPQGLMFQSDKGIWLLGRDLSTNYIGAPVEQYNDAAVLSAVNVPGTNQVRFTLDNGITLMYDYFFGQWGTFAGIPGIASTLYGDLHTYVNSLGAVYQETPGAYLDGSNPVLMTFTTGWMNLAGLQGFERAYFFYILGTYLTPHKLSVGIAYDYNPSIVQTNLITPDNYNPTFGYEDGPYGSGDPYGGASNVEQWRVFLQTQKCQAFQITVTEVFDPSYGTIAGAGLTLSGLNLVVGIKKGYTTIRAARSTG